MSPAVGDKGDLIAVWREGGLIVEGWVVGQTLETRAIHMHSIEIGFAGPIAFRCKYDPLSIHRKRRIVVESGNRKQRSLSRAIGVGNIQCHLRRPEAMHEHGLFGAGRER